MLHGTVGQQPSFQGTSSLAAYLFSFCGNTVIRMKTRGQMMNNDLNDETIISQFLHRELQLFWFVAFECEGIRLMICDFPFQFKSPTPPPP